MRYLIFTIFTAIVFMSCDETKKVIDTAGNVQLSGSYTIESINGSEVSENIPTITFTALDKGIKGNAGCNSFFGKYTLDLYALSFQEIAATEMYCEQPIMDVENSFLQGLNNTGSYSLEDGILTLYSKTDRSVLITAKKDKTDQ